MTLRARLAVAFFAVLVGPLLIGAVLFAEALRTSGSSEAQLERANAAVRMAVGATCRHLAITARAMAAEASIRGESFVVKPASAPSPWIVCGQGASSLAPNARFAGLAARAEVHGSGGELTGYAYAVQPLDPAFLGQLSAAAGGRVSLVDAGEFGLRLEFDADQPLPLVLARTSGDDFPIVMSVALAAGLAAAVLAWWLAGLATRPLGDLLAAVDRAAAGDLTVRPPVAGRDEAALLSHGIDRLIAEMQESRHLSVTDELTGLGNVRHLADSLRLEVERASRFGRALGVLVLDLDHFKAVNDRYGHRAGDAVLVELAGRIRGVVREVDLAFRQGGEEFVILLPETDVAGSLTAARRIGESVRDRPFTLGQVRNGTAQGLVIPITVSVGIAVVPRHALTGPDVLDAADAALYAAKAAGRDTFVLAGAVVPEQGRARARAGAAARAPAGRGESGGSSTPASRAAG